MINTEAKNNNMLTFLEKANLLSRTTILILDAVILLIVGVLDYVTGYEIAFSIFYLIPVGISALLLGRMYFWFFSFLSALLWVLLDIGTGHTYSSLFIAFWNSIVRMGFFIIVSYLLGAVKDFLEKERKQARMDFLTGIPNARSFYETGEKELYRAKRYKRPLTVAYIDADNFKEINDKQGHDRGDALLQRIGKEISGNIRVSDLAARLGGDEFAIIFPETDVEKAKIIVKNIKISLDKMIKDSNLPVTFSIGMVTCVSGNCSIQDLIKQADNQMYKVKNKGKDNIFSHVID